MQIKITRNPEGAPQFTADCEMIPGMPPVGWGDTKQAALGDLLLNLAKTECGAPVDMARPTYASKYLDITIDDQTIPPPAPTPSGRALYEAHYAECAAITGAMPGATSIPFTELHGRTQEFWNGVAGRLAKE